MSSFLSILFIVVFIEWVLSGESPEAVLTELQQNQREDRACFAKFDRALAKIWGEKLNETDVSGLGKIPKTSNVQEPKKPKYNTAAQEWLMEDPYRAKKLGECSAGLYKLIDNDNRICAEELSKRLIKNEENYVVVTEQLFSEGSNTVPFGPFFTFKDLELILFQNRGIDNLTNHENNTYGHIESYVPSDEDKGERTWILRQECDWNDLKDIIEAGDDEVPDLFRSQVLRAVDRELGNQLVRYFDLNANVTHANYNAWIKAREDMKSEVETIVGELNTVKKDDRWLCEYAGEIGNRFAVDQANILLPQSSFYVDLKARDVARRARDLEYYLKTLKDDRSDRIEELADEFGAGLLCLESLATLMLDHQRYEVASHFVGKGYSYPEIFCRQMNINAGLIAPEYCKCVGSFCVSHDIAALYAERFELKKNKNNGGYAVGITNVNTPTTKVVAWPGIKEF